MYASYIKNANIKVKNLFSRLMNRLIGNFKFGRQSQLQKVAMTCSDMNERISNLIIQWPHESSTECIRNQ